MDSLELQPLNWPIEWAYASGKPEARAQIKAHCSDFLVTEDLGYQPCGESEHVYLDITKTDTNTEFLARHIAKLAGVPAKQVNYSGLKDRRGVTRQWFGVHLRGKSETVDADWQQLQSPEVHLHQAVTHLRKLKTGVHQGNFFALRLRNISPSENLERKLGIIAAQGAPSYFGDQRFGRQGGNLSLALSMLQGKRIKDRFKRSMALSSASSYLFNQLLSARVGDGSWLQAAVGERCMFSDGFSQFDAAAEVDLDGVQKRIDGGIWPPILKPWQPWIDSLVAQDMSAHRRSVRLWPKGFSWSWCEGNVLELKFHLMRGSYATALVREIVQTDQLQ